MAAETQSKRQREETQADNLEESKRHKPYNHMLLSLLEEEEEEEEETTQNLSSLITTLQEELCSSDSAFDPQISCLPTTKQTQTDDQEVQENHHTTVTITIQDYPSSSSSALSFPDLLKEDKEEERERVMRHLLEASDDELGIPNREGIASNSSSSGTFEDGHEEGRFVDDVVNGGDVPTLVDGFSLCDGLWEFEDVNANYYALVQSELFM